MLLLRITEGPVAGEDTNAATAGDGADATGTDTTAQQTLLAILVFVGVNAITLLVVVLLGTVLVVVIARSRRRFHELEPDAKAAIVAEAQQGIKMRAMGGDSSFASEPRGLATRDSGGAARGVAAAGFAPRLPPKKPSRGPGAKPALRKPAPKKPARASEEASATKKKKKKKKKKSKESSSSSGATPSAIANPITNPDRVRRARPLSGI